MNMVRTVFFILLIISCSNLFAEESLKLWGDFNLKEVEVLQGILEEFERESNILVELKTKADRSDLFEASKNFDVIATNIPNTIELIEKDLIIPLEDIISQETVANSMENLIKAFEYESTLYGIPKSFDTLALFYNPTIFESAGLELPTNDWTWNEFIEASSDLKVEGYSNSREDFYQTRINKASVVISNEVFGFLPYLLSYTKSSEDQEEIARAFETYVNWRQEGFITTSDELAAGWAGEIFLGGQVAMTVEGSWLNRYIAEYASLIDLDFEYKTVMLPKNPETNEQGNLLFAEGYLITKNAEKKGKQALAKNLIEFLSREDNQLTIFKQIGSLPAHKNLQAEQLSDISNTPDTLVNILEIAYGSVEQAVPLKINSSALNALNNFTTEQFSVVDIQDLLAEINSDGSKTRSLSEAFPASAPAMPSAIPVEEVEFTLPVPYIHQLQDTPKNFDGSWASLPTCAAMLLAYYDLLPKKPIELSELEEHISNYGYYIANSFSYEGHSFNIEAPTKASKAAGLYGAIVNSEGYGVLGEEKKTLGLLETLKIFMDSEYDVSVVDAPKAISSTKYIERKFAEALMRESLDKRNPIIVAGDLTFTTDSDNIYTFHHFVVVSGYYKNPETNELLWIVNDPYGFTIDEKNQTVISSYESKNRKYTFKQLNPKYMVTINKKNN